MVPTLELVLPLYLHCAEVKVSGPMLSMFRFVLQLPWECNGSLYLHDFAVVVVHLVGEYVDLTKN